MARMSPLSEATVVAARRHAMWAPAVSSALIPCGLLHFWKSNRVTLHFAYGSNMSRRLMNARCAGAPALGTATLAGWRFIINPEGFGSIAPRQGGRVHGVLWRL